MKKCFVLCALAALAAVPLFAAVEVGGNLYAAPISSRRIDFGGETGRDWVHEIFPAGMQASATFFFSGMKTFNAGLNVGLGWDRVRFVQHDGQHSLDGGWNMEVQAGPAFEFMFGRHSLFVSPGAAGSATERLTTRGMMSGSLAAGATFPACSVSRCTQA